MTYKKSSYTDLFELSVAKVLSIAKPLFLATENIDEEHQWFDKEEKLWWFIDVLDDGTAITYANDHI